jgi:hypothetical protein
MRMRVFVHNEMKIEFGFKAPLYKKIYLIVIVSPFLKMIVYGSYHVCGNFNFGDACIIDTLMKNLQSCGLSCLIKFLFDAISVLMVCH